MKLSGPLDIKPKYFNYKIKNLKDDNFFASAITMLTKKIKKYIYIKINFLNTLTQLIS